MHIGFLEMRGSEYLLMTGLELLKRVFELLMHLEALEIEMFSL